MPLWCLLWNILASVVQPDVGVPILRISVERHMCPNVTTISPMSLHVPSLETETRCAWIWNSSRHPETMTLTPEYDYIVFLQVYVQYVVCAVCIVQTGFTRLRRISRRSSEIYCITGDQWYVIPGSHCSRWSSIVCRTRKRLPLKKTSILFLWKWVVKLEIKRSSRRHNGTNATHNNIPESICHLNKNASEITR